MSIERPIESLSDDELMRGLVDLLSGSRRNEAKLVAHIGEVEARRLFAREAAPSMFVYCTDVLHLSEAEAYLRIHAARAAREHPVLLEMLGDGRLHLCGIALLAPRLTSGNRDAVLPRAIHKTKRQIEELVAELYPRPDAPALIRKLPNRSSGPESESATPELRLDGVAAQTLPREASSVPGSAVVPGPAVVEPLSPARFKVQFTAGAELREKLERLRVLMRHEVPDGDLAQVIEKAVTEKLERLEARRFGRTTAPRTQAVRASPSSRHVPAAVRRIVYLRDGGRCRYIDAQGRRCLERSRLEFHHRHPYALGGGSEADNICLMCAAHNRLMGEADYGRRTMSRFQAKKQRSPNSVQTELQP